MVARELTIEPAQPGATEADNRGAVVAALMLTVGLAAIDSTIVATAVPQIVSDLGGFSLFPWIFSIYLLTQRRHRRGGCRRRGGAAVAARRRARDAATASSVRFIV